MKHENVRARLIESTIHSIATNGLYKTTTKAIVSGTSINEAYIYSHFADKEDLFARAFDTLDEELVSIIIQNLPIMSMPAMDLESRCRALFLAVWRLLLENREKCIAYVQYYYSPYFVRHSAGAHHERCQPICDRFCKVFREEADVWMILNHMLNVMFDFAIKVHNGQMSDEDDYVEHVFLVIYRSIIPYFKEEEVQGNE